MAINPNTVLKAYKELEGKGLAVGRPGQGTLVEGTLEQVDLVKLAHVRRTLLAWLADASAVGLDEDGMVALFTTALHDFCERVDAAPRRTASPRRSSSKGGAA